MSKFDHVITKQMAPEFTLHFNGGRREVVNVLRTCTPEDIQYEYLNSWMSFDDEDPEGDGTGDVTVKTFDDVVKIIQAFGPKAPPMDLWVVAEEKDVAGFRAGIFGSYWRDTTNKGEWWADKMAIGERFFDAMKNVVAILNKAIYGPEN